MKSAEILADVKLAKALLIKTDGNQRKNALDLLFKNLQQNRTAILSANQKDVSAATGTLSEASVDRMILNDQRFEAILESLMSVINLPDIIGEVYDVKTQPSGITVSKLRVPLGVILMIYESRPNVTIDAAALAIKTGNAIILKGGSEAKHTNQAFGEVISESLKQADLPAATAVVIAGQPRELTQQLLGSDDVIDLVIPRGSRKLLEFVQQNTRIPTLLHLEGNCHIYIDTEADPTMAAEVTLDAKTQRYGTCNTVESLLIHRDRQNDILPALTKLLNDKNVEIRGDSEVCKLIAEAIPANDSDWSQEYLGPVISIKLVGSVDEAIEHINKYGSGHTDSIITGNIGTAEQFLQQVNSSSTMHNTSTRLADGYEYGLGAEIGISTGKLHARGPVGQEGLTTYKWIVKSDGVTKSGILNTN